MVEQIKLMCAATKTSVRALERAIGAGSGTIARWDEHTPSINYVVAVADYFGVTIDQILGRSVKEKSFMTEEQEQLLSISNTLTKEGNELLLEIARGVAVQSKYKKRKSNNRDKSANDKCIEEA